MVPKHIFKWITDETLIWNNYMKSLTNCIPGIERYGELFVQYQDKIIMLNFFLFLPTRDYRRNNKMIDNDQ